MQDKEIILRAPSYKQGTYSFAHGLAAEDGFSFRSLIVHSSRCYENENLEKSELEDVEESVVGLAGTSA